MSWALRGRRVLVTLAVAVVATAGAAHPAFAQGHDRTASDPADGAALPSAPKQVTVQFDAPADPLASHLSVRAADGTDMTDGDVTAAGDSLSVPVAIEAKGDYTVAYHAIFADGQETFGVVQFSVGTGVAPVPLPVAQALERAKTLTSEHSHSGVDPVGAVLLFIDLLVLCAVFGLLWLRRPGDRGRAGRLVARP